MREDRREHVAETIAKFHPGWSERYRDFCRQMADDLELQGWQRTKFLERCHAFQVTQKVAS